ncbi:hypothetical protein Dimus_003611 [Dionaea muscipula]
MKDNGMSNVMELIKRQKWENLFKRRDFVFVDAVKEFYARMTVTHLKKKDIVKSSVKGVEAVIDEAAEQGESGSDNQFFDAQVDVEEPVTETPAAPEVVAQDSVQQKETKASGVDPSGGLSGHLPESMMNKLQADFEKARAYRIQVDLEKAQAENVRLLALLQQAQSKPKS